MSPKLECIVVLFLLIVGSRIELFCTLLLLRPDLIFIANNILVTS